MAETSIEWADFSFNPWRGCRKVSPACKNCYAETRGKRFGEDFSGQRIVLSDAGWKNPIKWNREATCSIKGCDNAATCDGTDGKMCDSHCQHMGNDSADHTEHCTPVNRRRVFCASLADVFEDWKGPIVNHKNQRMAVNASGDWFAVPAGNVLSHGSRWLTMNDVRRRLFELIDATPHLDWLLLTKRPENIRKVWPEFKSNVQGQYSPMGSYSRMRRDNVWLGATVENQATCDDRVEDLHNVQDLCRFRFYSCEPLLGPLKLSLPQYPIDWLIAGGESGSNARPSHPDWFRSLLDQCDAAGVPFHFKQWGEWQDGSSLAKGSSHENKIMLLDGRHAGTPDSLGFKPSNSIEWHKQKPTAVARVGKKKAGRLLDGVEHNGAPEVAL